MQVTRELQAGLDEVWRVMSDAGQLTACLPGARMTATLGGDRYRGQASVSLGPVKLAFKGIAQIISRDAASHQLAMLAEGTEQGGSRTSAEIRLEASATPGGVRLRADADLFLSGRIAQFGRALAGDVSQRLFEQFTASLEQAARTGSAPPPGKSLNAWRIGARAVAGALRRRARRLRRRWRPATGPEPR